MNPLKIKTLAAGCSAPPACASSLLFADRARRRPKRTTGAPGIHIQRRRDGRVGSRLAPLRAHRHHVGFDRAADR